jgi:hypothetical protein
MKPNLRERQIRKSRKLVTDEQLLLFLRALRTPGQPPFAVEEINKDLDDGESLDQIFYTGKPDGFSLEIRRLSDSRLEIGFSWNVEVTAPDGTVFGEGDGVTCFAEIDEAGGIRLTGEGIITMS